MRIGAVLVALGAFVLAGGGRAAADPPRRVVSMNLCTDQLAMMLAAPGQLVSVSYLAQDPRASAMAAEAAAYPANHGLAEEIFLLAPDLVIAGSFTTRATVEMLRRLRIPVAVFEPAHALNEVPDRLRQMGEVLGRQDQAEARIRAFAAGLAALAPPPGPQPRAATYAANGYTAGPASLSGGILAAAGLANVAAELGLSGGGQLALEQLAMAGPDLVILPQPYPGASQAEDLLRHPALLDLIAAAGVAPMTDRDWVCGTPHVLTAIAAMAQTRAAWQAGR